MPAGMPRSIAAAARILWEYHLVYDELVSSDLIIGLGSYDLRVADRCAQLFRLGLAPSILFTGKAGNWTQGLYPSSEAEAFAARAEALGVPSDCILVEPHATNIGENIRFARSMSPGVARAIIITKPQTQRRALATVKAQWPEISALVSAPLTSFEQQPTANYPLDMLIAEMVGDIRRIIDYPALGFQIPQAVPDEVLRACDHLVAHGHDGHLHAKP